MNAPSTLTTEVIGDHVWSIGLNRPDKRNAFNLQMLTELSDAMTHYEDSDDLWCAVLHAHGDHLSLRPLPNASSSAIP